MASRTRVCPAADSSNPPQNSDAEISGTPPRSMTPFQNSELAACAFPRAATSRPYLMLARALLTVLDLAKISDASVVLPPAAPDRPRGPVLVNVFGSGLG